VQMHLMHLGLYRAGIDGVYGPGMSVALRTYQAQEGLELTGRLDAQTLASLDLYPPHRRRLSPFYHPMFGRRTRIGPGDEPVYLPR
jgi:peptidoglycan hydrolase-like protein with peptidoglycan-binding domain